MPPSPDRQPTSQMVQSTVQVGGRTPKAGGRLLDGRTWDQFPPANSVALRGDEVVEQAAASDARVGKKALEEIGAACRRPA